MARPEKTVFISYRRKDISWALAVYHYLTKHDYDVFFDYKNIPSGDFEQIIVGNIKARAHFLVILTPTALDRASEPGDWLRREIENAISERRNIIPLFFDGFNFGAPSVSEKLTGKLGRLKRYNGLEVPAGYFDEAMERLRGRYLNVALDAVLHPVSEEVQKKVKEHQVAANQAISSKEELDEKARKEKELQEKKEAEERARIAAEIKAKKEQGEKERRLAEEKAKKEEIRKARRAVMERIRKGVNDNLSRMLATVKGFFQKINPKQYGIGAVVIMALIILTYGGNYIVQNLPTSNALDVTNIPTFTIVSPTLIPTKTITSTPAENPTITPTQTPMPIPTVDYGSMVSPKDRMTLRYVPAGEFIMGSDNGDDEKPAHNVYLNAFWIDQTEVTNAMYARCVQAGSCELPSDTYYYDDPSYTEHPVVHVSWNDARMYCSWANRRLPTEAEWEKAASWDERNNQKRRFPWGDDYQSEMIGRTFPTYQVGIYPKGASPYGVLDMAGNVAEWVSDWYSGTYYAESPSANPIGPNSGESRVVRGFSYFLHFEDNVYRWGISPAFDVDFVGFRCAMDAE